MSAVSTSIDLSLLPSFPTVNVGGNPSLEFSKISIREDYRQQWNIHQNDFICLTKGGELVRDTLYRIGGMGSPKLGKCEYFMILKHVEAHYPDNITKDQTRKPHLESRWCILDKDGNEKVEFEAYTSAYLIKDSCIYSVDRKYYNVETKELYCYASSSIQSSEFLFLENSFDDDKAKRGVMKIHKKSGKWELFT